MMRQIRSGAHLRVAGAAGLVVLMAFGAVGPAVAHGPDPILGGLFVQDQALTFRWRSGSEPPAILKTAIRDAAADSGATRGSRAPTFAYASGGTSQIGYGTGTCGVNGIGCFTRTAPESFTMWLREHGRVYDWGVLRWCQMLSSPANGCYDAETIALDEFGHVEGLGHHVNRADDSDYTDAVVQTLSRTRPKAGYDMHRYGVCDVATLQMRYDLPAASSPYSTCLDLTTSLSVAVDDASVSYGASATFSSVLKVALDPDYLRLSGNGVSARAVRLQRRSIGSTTWATFATLVSGSPAGTYRVTLRLYDTADYRAVFSTPSSEGLRGDTSPTVRVTVTPCTAKCPLPIVGP
ncbi:MAG: hypothetical protein ACXW4L_05370 [Candidatus Limnocylindrales bacterium]